MSVITNSSREKTGSIEDVDSLAEQAAQLDLFVRQASADGESLDAVERHAFDQVLRMGHRTVDLFLSLQGNGDLGPSVVTEADETLDRSDEPVRRELRTVFGLHVFDGFVYSPGPHLKIALRPLEARMSLPAGINSYLFEEFSQFFCVEQAFGLSRQALMTTLRQDVCVDQLQDINHRLGIQADEYLEELPVPAASDEGELLVLTGDGKGVPLVRADAARIPVTSESPARPGNRRMAILAGVYSVDCYHRTADDVLAGLFRDADRPKQSTRPKPRFKEVRACFTQSVDDGDGSQVEVNGQLAAFTWAARRVESRLRPGQTLIRLLDGQVSLREISEVCLPDEVHAVDILDIIHVAGYVQRAAKVFYSSAEQREAFSRQTLGKLLTGKVESVIHSLHVRAGLKKLKGQSAKEIATVRGYFERNKDRMRYHQYLARGYPIGTGVIEGACRHLVKDRMERTGMRWRLSSATAMLNVRAVFQSSHWETFHQTRIAKEQSQLHPHRALINNDQPLTA
jgi:hypothetical protein